MSIFSRTSLFHRYLASYLGIAIATCALMGLLLVNSATQELIQETRQAEQTRLDMARDDLVNFLDILDQLTLRIATETVYQPFYLAKGPMNHMTMLESFCHYQDYSPLFENYYLYYPDTETVFTPSAEYRFYLFAKNFYGYEADEMRSLILSNQKFLCLDDKQERFLISYPIQFRLLGNHTTAYFLCELDMTTLQQRFQDMFMLSGPIEIEYQGLLLGNALENAKCLESQAEFTGGKISLRVSSTEAVHNVNFQTRALLVIVMVAVAISVFSIFLAWRS